MEGLERLTIIRDISIKKGSKWVHKDIFRLLNKKDIWLTAYTTVQKTEKTADNFLNILEEQEISELIHKVSNEDYKPVFIKKGQFTTREKESANQKFFFLDKIVVEVIKMILKAISDPLISESNVGIIKNKNEHSALQYIEKEFSTCDVIIQGNIGNCVTGIDNSILCNFINKRIADTRFINLIRKVLTAESELLKTKTVLINRLINNSLKQLLFNIYINQFDEWIKKCTSKHVDAKYNVKLHNTAFGVDTRFDDLHASQKYYKLSVNERKERNKENQKVLFLTNSKTAIRYVRYIEDWIIGIEKDTNLAVKFKEKIETFLLNTLKLPLVKTKLVSLTNGNISFLNYEIYLPRVNIPNDFIKRNCVEKNKLRFEAPIKKLLEEMEINGFIKALSSGYRSISKTNLTTSEDYAIVFYFNSIWIALCKYYSGTTNPHRLQYIHNLLQISCAMTLAHKHRSSCSEIFRKKGKSLTIYTPETKRKISFTSKAGLYFTNRKWETNAFILNPFELMKNQRKNLK